MTGRPTNARRQQVGAFYARHADRLRRIVATRVAASEYTIEDACQSAWAILLGFDHVRLDGSGLAWLAKVAIREGWRLSSTRREVPMAAMRSADDGANEWTRGAVAEAGADERAIANVLHAERLADLRMLKPRERRELFLLAVGYSYEEIAELTASTYTGVNRRLAEGRAQLRQLARERCA